MTKKSLNQATLEELLSEEKIENFLLDAAGVIYNLDGPVSGIKEAVKTIQEQGKNVFLVSNNSTIGIDAIHKKLLSIGVEIDKEKVLTSGLGLRYEENINAMIRGKKCYVLGWPESMSYLDKTGVIKTDQIEEAEVIIFLSSFQKNNEKYFLPLAEHLKTKPHIPFICTNPDFHVYSKKGMFKVLGHYVKELEKYSGLKAHWFGKPFSNFHFMVKKLIHERFDIDLEGKSIFFDDNYHNVKALSHDLKIKACLIKNTGLWTEEGLPQEEIKPFLKENLSYINSFSFH